jgi:hypothetical protein
MRYCVKVSDGMGKNRKYSPTFEKLKDILNGDKVHIRVLQCFKLDGNQTENDRYWQKNNFLQFAKCLKMHRFFSI